MGNYKTKPTYNPYNIPNKVFNFYKEIFFDEEDHDYYGAINFVNINVNKLRQYHANLKVKKKHYCYYCIVLSITHLERYYNVTENPATGEPWINLITEMQQLAEIFGNLHDPNMA